MQAAVSEGTVDGQCHRKQTAPVRRSKGEKVG